MNLKNSAAACRRQLDSAPARFAGCAVVPIRPPQAVAGVDVGEDFLDLAVLRTATPALEHHRIALRGIEDDPLALLRERLARCCPDAGPQWMALIDSPRWPVDLDYSSAAFRIREPAPPGRTLDHALRAMLRVSARHNAIRLSMFPTPKLAYFKQSASAPDCKPHLRSAYRWLFQNATGSAPSVSTDPSPSASGGNFTRFMLAGFLTFRAWRELGAQVLEAYPDLQYRLASPKPLAPKRAGKAAVAERIAITTELRRSLGIGSKFPPQTLDQADAEILALTATMAARRRSLAALENPAEGRFLITFKPKT